MNSATAKPLVAKPIQIPSFNGASENDKIAPAAKRSIFFRLYLLEPLNRLLARYGRGTERKPSQVT